MIFATNLHVVGFDDFEDATLDTHKSAHPAVLLIRANIIIKRNVYFNISVNISRRGGGTRNPWENKHGKI